MEDKIEFNQKNLILKVNKNYDKSIINMDKWGRYLDVLCGDRLYQKEAIFNSIIFLASGLYKNTEDLISENYQKNDELSKKYNTIEDYLRALQIKDKLCANIDLATGTGKSYVIYGIAQIMMSEGFVSRVLILCPSLTIEKGLTKKFLELSSNSKLTDAIPQDAKIKNPRIIDAENTIKKGDFCIENIHAVYDATGSSIKDSFKNGGSDTLILNDESHHIYNKPTVSKTISKNFKKWKNFLISNDYNFKYILGFTGTAYIENDYFNDVIYRYSLRSAIDDKMVKSIDYVQKDDIGSNLDYKFQKILKNHEENKYKYSIIKPLTILVTKDIKSAINLYEDLLDFLVSFENKSITEIEKKLLIVTSDSKHKSNLVLLDYVDNKDNEIEWIISVSMLTEGWDVKNVMQIVPWEDRAFNSKLLISQVLGRGLRIPIELHTQPSVTIFNHDSWSKNIKSLVNEVLEIETKLISTVKFNGVRNKYNFELKNLIYDKEEKEIQTNSDGKEIDYSKTWNEGIKLKSQTLSTYKETEYEGLISGSKNIKMYDIKLRTKTISEVVNKILHEFRLRDWETKIIGLGDDDVYSKANLPPQEKIKAIIQKSMDNAGIEGDFLIEENANAIFTSFSTLFRPKSKTIVNKLISTDFVDVNTNDMNDENRGVSSFRNDNSLFYTDQYEHEMPTTDQLRIMNTFLEDESFPRKASKLVNFYDFKTPQNVVITTASPEYDFVNKHLIKHENAVKIKAWIKSRDMNFYSIEYSYTINSHTKQGSFNPDFFIKLNNQNDNIILIIEIKDDNDDSIENKGKNRAAKEHFNLINKKILENNGKDKYIFHFLSPEDYDTFFAYLQENKIETFVSGLDNKLDNN